MIIAVDAAGGDHAPEAIVKGTCDALKTERDIEKILLVGDESEISSFIDAEVRERIEIVHTKNVIEMDEHPANAYRSKKDASVVLASRLVKEGKADAIVSAGSTGAQLVSGLFEIGRIRGIKRPAIAVLLPSLTGPKVLIDSGANTEVTPDILLQFALMGDAFARIVKPGKQEHRVALVNNGSEETKGTKLLQETYQLLADTPQIHFSGNIEGNGILSEDVDVIVCDGFTGNVILKTMEGMGKALFTMLKKEAHASTRNKIGGYLLKPGLTGIKRMFDSREVGGSPLLGLQGVSIVCHGNSDRVAFANGIRMAENCVKNHLIAEINQRIKETAK